MKRLRLILSTLGIQLPVSSSRHERLLTLYVDAAMEARQHRELCRELEWERDCERHRGQNAVEAARAERDQWYRDYLACREKLNRLLDQHA